MIGQAAVEQAYKSFNRRFFDNKLPKDTELKIVYIPGLLGYQLGEQIVLNKKYRTDSVWKATLLHEMAHLKLEDDPSHEKSFHGKKFQKEMLRLAKCGAFKGIW